MSSYVLSNDELRRVQLIQLEMLCEVDRICKKNDIKYNIIAGTLLGAVRHEGFIPWDDDADVAFLRSEYDKFLQAIKKDLDKEKFYFQDHRNTEGYRWGYGKLRRNDTLFLREGQENMPYEQGVFIDIFPLDNVPDNKVARIFTNIHCFFIRKCMWAPIGKKQSPKVIGRLGYGLLEKIPDKWLFGHYDKYIEKTKKRKSSWVRILTYPTPNSNYGYKKKWYENSSQIIFEEKTFSGIKEWDEYLNFKFGDYMQLPKESERKRHSVTKLEINV